MQPRRRFRFIKEIAQGGFGKVYMAEMITGENFSSVVAIKVLHGRWSTHEEIVQRARDEARLLGRLRHRNIVRVEDLTAIRGQCAVIMEYLEGVDLKTLTNHQAQIGAFVPARATFEIVGQVATAVVRVVEKEDVAGVDIALEEVGHRLRRPGQRADVDRHVFGLRDQAPLRIADAGREIAAGIQDLRIRGAQHRLAHLLDDGGEAVGEHGDGDGVDHGRSIRGRFKLVYHRPS